MKIAGASPVRPVPAPPWAGTALPALSADGAAQPLPQPASLTSFSASRAPVLPSGAAAFSAEAHAALAPSTAHATIDIFMASFPL